MVIELNQTFQIIGIEMHGHDTSDDVGISFSTFQVQSKSNGLRYTEQHRIRH